MNFDGFEQTYFTKSKHMINFTKHFQEASPDKENVNINLFTHHYFKKVSLREQMVGLSPSEFRNSKLYNDQEIWDLKYMSSDDEEMQSNSSGSESESESDSEEDKENKTANMFKNTNKEIPDVVKILKKRNDNNRVRYEETVRKEGDKPEKKLVISRVTSRATPNDLIELLVRDKK
jgi:hypothetical protein